MAHRSSRSPGKGSDSVRIGRRTFPVIDRMTIGRRQYLILKKTGTGDRRRFMGFDPHSGPEGDLRSILVLPRSRATEQHVRVLKPLSTDNVNLPQIMEYRIQGDDLVVVLAWIRGVDLATYLNDIRAVGRPRPSATEAFRLVQGLAHGLAHLHRRRAIVHGDIKPANLILTPRQTRLVMIDFGNAWGIERTAAREEGDGLSRAYASPELQSGNGLLDWRADQFSASAVLYELLTLERPYDALGGQAGLPQYADRMKDKLVPPSRMSPDRGRLPREVWKGIDRVVTTGLSLEPDGRYPTPAEWLDALDRVRSTMRPQSRITPLNSRLTRVVTWLADKLRRD